MLDLDAIIEYAEVRGLALDINGPRGTIKLAGRTFKSVPAVVAFIRAREAGLNRMGMKSPACVRQWVGA